jgi:tRNA(Ile)-lysidine synthase
MLPVFVTDFRAHFPELCGARVLVALSGGGDSVALLHLLLAASGELGCRISAAHVHHHARGYDADADAAFCAQLAARLGVPFTRLDIASPRGAGESREAFWRRERYRRLEQARVAGACAAVATGHTLEDQAETVLLKLLRGSGPRGVAGIRRRTGAVIRPLLGLHRGDLREWLVQRGEAWREDETNADRSTPRGRIRHDLLPRVMCDWPGAVEHLAAFASMLGEDEALLARWAGVEAPFPAPGNPVVIDELTALPRPLLRRWALALAARLPLGEPPSRAQLAAVEAMLSEGRPAAVDLGRRWVLRRRGGRLWLSPPVAPPFSPVEADAPSETRLPGGFVARLGMGETGARFHAWLRPLVGGTRFAWRSLGSVERCAREQERRFRKRLAAVGVPAEWRRAWPVLEVDGTIVWVPGLPLPLAWAGDRAAGLLAELEEPWKNRTRS